MKQNFNDCLSHVLKDEGGYTNDPSDSGGPTNYGITIGDVRKYIKRDATAQDVRNLTLDQAQVVYKQRYWDTLGCDDLASGVDYTCFDYGVNSGLGRPRKALRQFKDKTGVELIDAINDERTAFLKRLAATQTKNQKFLRGWLSRVYRVDQYSKQLAKSDNVSGPVSGGTVATVGVVLSQYFHQHEALIIGGTVVVAIVLGLLIHYIKNKGK